jgi:hypothetical protein
MQLQGGGIIFLTQYLTKCMYFLELALRYKKFAQLGQQLAVHALTSAELKRASSTAV